MGQEFRYYQCGDYFIPDIQLNPYKHKVLGKYGRMRRVYLQEQNPMLLKNISHSGKVSNDFSLFGRF